MRTAGLLLTLALLARAPLALAQAPTAQVKPFAAQAEIYQPIDSVWRAVKDQRSWPQLVPSLFGPDAPPIQVDLIPTEGPYSRSVVVETGSANALTLAITVTLRASSPSSTTTICKVSYLRPAPADDRRAEEDLAIGLLRNLAVAARPVVPTWPAAVALRPVVYRKPTRRPTSYTAYMGVGEALGLLAGLGLTVSGAALRPRPGWVPLILGFPVLTSISVPIVHLARGNADRAAQSLFMRAWPWVLGLGGMGVVGVNNCASRACESGMALGATLTVVLGLVAAETLDYALLSNEPRKPPPLSFLVGPTPGGASAGVGGSF